MDLKPLIAELDQQSPRREVVIEELDKVTDPLRGGYPTTEIIDQLFDVFYRLITFNQWHIQQYALSCTKYLFENSTFSQDEKIAVLKRHLNYTEKCGSLLGDAKREVREMSAQCIGQLALHVGPILLNEEFGIAPHIFNPEHLHFPIEGQQMALGRLATAFRIVDSASLAKIFDAIVNDESIDVLKNASENGYGFWYSTRALNLFVTAKLDCTLSKHSAAFEKSREFVLEHYKDRIIKCALKRLQHHYANCRRAAAGVVASVYASLKEGREAFLESLLPTADMKWVQREGHLCALAQCLDETSPLDAAFVDGLCQKLVALVEDPIDCDSAPVTQKGNANSWAARALVKVLKAHSIDLYEKYIHSVVVSLLKNPVAALLDGGVISAAELSHKEGIDTTDLLILMFKNVCHTSFPIKDLARRTVDVRKLVSEQFDGLLSTLLEFSESEDAEVRECVAKALQLVKKNTDCEIPHAVTECALALAGDSNEAVQAAAVDLLRVILTEESVEVVPELVCSLLSSESEDAAVAAMKLLKTALEQHRDAIAATVNAVSPLLAFHALSPISSPVVGAAAQQLLAILASSNTESDEEIRAAFDEIDIEEADSSEFEELVCESADRSAAASTLLQAVLDRFLEELGAESVEEVLEGLTTTLNGNEAADAINLADKEASVHAVAAAALKIAEMDAARAAKTLQALADVYADESLTEKQSLLFVLDHLRKQGELKIPDPTPFSLSHDSETFSKYAARA